MVVWIALGSLLVAVVGGLVFAGVRGFQLYRAVKRGGSEFSAEMERISDVTLRIERQMANAEAATERLHDATERLALSRARLDVQLAAVREARTRMRRVFWFVPGV